MRAIETLLGIVEMKRADGLVVALGDVPALLLSGGRQALTMPALSQDMMEHVLVDLLAPEQRAALQESGKVEASYQSTAYGAYEVHARALDGKPVITLRRVASGARKSSVAVPPLPNVPPVQPHEAPPIRAASISQSMHSEDVAVSGSLDRALREAIAQRASDLIVSSGRAPVMRVDGVLVECQDAAPMPSAIIEAYVLAQLGAEGRRDLERTGSVDFALEHSGAHGGQGRFRANAFRHDGGIAIALRPIVTEIPRLTELNLPPSLAQLVEQRTGLVLFTGATGSGSPPRWRRSWSTSIAAVARISSR